MTQCREPYCHNPVEQLIDKQVETRNGFYCSNSWRYHKKPDGDASGGLSLNSGEFSNFFFPLKDAEHGFCKVCKDKDKKDRARIEEIFFQDPFLAIREASLIGETKVCWSKKKRLFKLVPADEVDKTCEELIYCIAPGIQPKALTPEGEAMILKI